MGITRFVNWRGSRKDPPTPSKRDKITRAIAQKKGGMTLRRKKLKVTLAGNHEKAPFHTEEE
jgi:hypothetical protein